MLVISPHLDDGVFACAEALASAPGSRVVTVFAGHADDPELRTGWDEQCGFGSAREAMAARRDEDRRALAIVGAAPVWLDFRDSQYGATPTVDAVAEALADLVADDDLVLYPLGLFHSDHRLVHDACRKALGPDRASAALAYEDVLYRSMPGMLQRRLAEFAAAGIEATPAAVGWPQSATERKARAVAAYASQLRAFGPGGYDDTKAPERCWRLAPRAAADSPR